MVVAASDRSHGIGRALLAECLRIALGADCYKVQLQSGDERVDAHRFYEREGFKASSKGFRYYFNDSAAKEAGNG